MDVPLLVTDMLYSATFVKGRANGGLHETLTVNGSIKEYNKSPTEVGSVECLACNYNNYWIL